jgi:hypothetical protein
MERIDVAVGTSAAQTFPKLGPMLRGKEEVSMPASSDIYLDGSNMPWQEFLNYLCYFKSVSEDEELFAHVRPPARCAAEARRVVRDMGLDDRIELLDLEPIDVELLRQDSGGFAPTAAPIAGSVRLRTPLRRVSIWWGGRHRLQPDPCGNGGSTPQDPTLGSTGEVATT